jgi:acyl carrier protein
MEEFRRLKSVCGDQARVISSYGVTEATIDSTYFEITAENQTGEGIVPIGRPFANSQIYLLDADQNPVPVGVPGELYLGGHGVARGYLNRPDLTAERFVEWTLPAETAKKQIKLYRTGDLARYRRDGVIEILGRADNQVKLRGYRIELGEIESALSLHPEVNECVVIVREDAPGDKRLIAYLTTKNDEINPGDLRRFIKESLPEYMVPSAFVLMKEWILTPNGKIDRKQLPAPDDAVNGSETDFIAPRNQVEEKLAGIWAILLRVERVGVNDNFFDLGGHSLLATQIVSRIRDAFGKNIPLRMLFETPTVASLAEQIGITESSVERVESTSLFNAESEENSLSLIEQQELEAMLAELENVSEEEAQQILEAETSESFAHSGN